MMQLSGRMVTTETFHWTHCDDGKDHPSCHPCSTPSVILAAYLFSYFPPFLPWFGTVPQVERGTQLAKERGLTNVKFQVMDALKMDFEDNTFDLVWACESGEHMPDKKKYIEEMQVRLALGTRAISR